MKHEKTNVDPKELISMATNNFLSYGKHYLFDPNEICLFSSKKHYVFRTILLRSSNFQSCNEIGKKIVLKLFNSKIKDSNSRWNSEIENYKKIFLRFKCLQGISIPKMIDFAPGVIIYEYIDGFNLSELAEKNQLKPEIINQYAKWVANLHGIGYIYGDPRLRNFTCCYNDTIPVVYGFDFEDIKLGSHEHNLTQFLASLIDENPGIFELMQLMEDTGENPTQNHLNLCHKKELKGKNGRNCLEQQVSQKIEVLNSYFIKYYTFVSKNIDNFENRDKSTDITEFILKIAEKIITVLRETALRRKLQFTDETWKISQNILNSKFLPPLT